MALAPLRPPGSEGALAALERAPASASAYADAARAYEDTAAAGMTIVWGLTSLSLEPRGERAPEVAQAIIAVLDARVGVSAADGAVGIRLAPGTTPVFAADGELIAPFAHVFEATFGVAVAPLLVGHGRPARWDLGRLQRGLAGFAGGFVAGEPLAPPNPLATLPHLWLADLHRAGHLDAFVAMAFRGAFTSAADAYATAHPAAMREAATYLEANPLRPHRPIMPDELVPLRRPTRP